ncbi:MAG: hypothetical protein JRN28_02780 [Nitrososphaerota archaeon]|nr:hypothetical protein [Nitrososphaerota archaeon]
MKLEKVGRLELTYTDMDEELSYQDGGQVYGILTGKLEAGELEGTLHTTNLARQRPDGVFTPTLRGLLTTSQGAKLFFTMDGLSLRDPKANPPRRQVVAGITFWTADPKFRSWNDVYLVAELEGRAVGNAWGVVGNLYQCIPEL